MRRRAQGFAEEPNAAAKGFGAPVFPDMSNVWNKEMADNLQSMGEAASVAGAEEGAKTKKVVQPKFQLPGPLKPPAAPATYKALTKIRLRVGPYRFADVLTSTEIEPGAVFRVVQAKDDEEVKGVTFLRADNAYEGGWLMDTGVAGQWAGKKVVKRVSGALGVKQGSIPVLEISEIDKAEVVGNAPVPVAEEAAPEDGGFADAERQREPILKLLEDPQVRQQFEQIGVDVEALKGNPEFLRNVARRLYGDEVVS